MDRGDISGTVDEEMATETDVRLNCAGVSDDDNDDDEDESFSEDWSFYECVVRGSAKGVERYLDRDPSLVNQSFRLSALVDMRQPHQVALGCYCWQYFEVGFQIDHLAGFYPGTLSWESRVYPQVEETDSSEDAINENG